MNIGAITFHGSHNYGSMLQAYALQTFVVSLIQEAHIPGKYQIINYRSDVQKKLYQPPLPGDSMKSILKWLMYLPYKRAIDLQNRKFEQYITERLQLTEECSSADELPQIASRFDVLLAGSDQIWNVRAKDFHFAYLFQGCHGRKVSYASSLGPLPIDWSQYDVKEYAALLRGFSSVSVREEASRRILAPLVEDVPIELMPDPVFLLSAEEWRKLESDAHPDRYILFYCLEPSREHVRLAHRLSKRLGLPVVSTGYRNIKDWLNPFIKQYDAGPCDFLSLIDHADVVLTSSFHGTAFSLIYGKPFWAIDGLSDARIRDLLVKFGAERNHLPLRAKDVFMPAMISSSELVICEERNKAKAYLIKALELMNEKGSMQREAAK